MAAATAGAAMPPFNTSRRVTFIRISWSEAVGVEQTDAHTVTVNPPKRQFKHGTVPSGDVRDRVGTSLTDDMLMPYTSGRHSAEGVFFESPAGPSPLNRGQHLNDLGVIRSVEGKCTGTISWGTVFGAGLRCGFSREFGRAKAIFHRKS